MTEQEQKAFDQMREALEQALRGMSAAIFGTDTYKVSSRGDFASKVEKKIQAALTAANAVQQAQGEAARLKAFLHKHKSSALPEGACVTCEGEGEIGGQFCGGFQECSDCAGTGKKSAHPQAIEPSAPEEKH